MSFGFGPLPRARQQESADLTPEQIAALYNPRRLSGTGATMTAPGVADAPAGLAEEIGAGGVAGFGAFPPVMPQGAPALDFDQRFDTAPPGQGYGLPGNAADALRSGLAPQDQPSPVSVPLPPARPSAADLGPLSFGPLPSVQAEHGPATLRVQPSDMADRGAVRMGVSVATPTADMPVAGAVPTAGQMPPLSLGPLPGAPAPASPPASAAPSPAPGEDGGFDLGGAYQRFGKNGGFDLMTNLGMGLVSTRGVGPGIAAGLQANQKQEALRATTDLARAEFGLKARKLQQADAGLNVARNQLAARGVPVADIDTALAAAAAGHNDPINNLLNRFFPKAPEAPSGFSLNPDGTMRRIAGGPQDPNVKREDAKATAEGSAAGKPDEPFNLSAGQTRYNADGTPIVSAGTSFSDVFDRETKLRAEFSKQLGIFQDVHDGYGRVIAATEQRQVNPNAKSPAADISLIFGYMKMLDPGSVVREGEYATAQNAASVPERVRNAYNKAMSGEFLSPEQRQGFIEQAESLYGKARGGAEGVAERYRGIASQYGVDPGRSVYLPDAYKPPKVGASRTKLPEAGSLPEIGSSRDAGGGITIKRVR